ncbi:MAG TPA: hypothetical protein VH583_16280, partial [Vicinamibacterales bacterium]
MNARSPRQLACVAAVVAVFLGSASVRGQFQQREPDFDRMVREQAETDATWRAASNGYMQMEKITYRSK